VRGGVKTQKYKMATNLSFQKIATVPASGLVVGRIYFETSTGMIKVATSATAVDKFGDGVKSASWDESAKTLKIINESGEEISLNLSDVASASAVTTELEKKLNIGTLGDTPSTQSYYGLKAHVGAEKLSAITAAKSYTDTEISKIPAAIVYKGDGTTVTQSGDTTVTFSVGTISQDKVSGLTTALSDKATITALNAVKATAEAAAPQAITYTKEEVDNKVASAVGSVYKMKGSVDDASALTALTGVVIGDVYNVVAAGTLNGEAFEAGSNFVAIKAGAGSQTGMWDKLGGTIDLSAYAKKAEVPTLTAFNSLTTTVDGKVTANANITADTKCKITYDAKGLVTAGANLEESDIPTLAISKISGLDTALNGKVPTTRKVNGKALSENIELFGDDIYVNNVSSAGATVDEALEDLYTKVSQAAASGVQSFGGQTGAITVDTANTTNGQVKFSMSSKQLKGTVNGLKSAAYTESSAYATSAQGTKADSAIQAVNGTDSNYIATSKSGTTVTVTSMLQAVASASSSAKGLAEASDVKAYVDSTVNSALTWAEFE
jgi:hypothetical protein